MSQRAPPHPLLSICIDPDAYKSRGDISIVKDEVEPIWVTAAKHDVLFSTFLWGRCDIPYDHMERLSPYYCENYYSTDLNKTLTSNVDRAVQQLQSGVDAAIVSTTVLLTGLHRVV